MTLRGQLIEDPNVISTLTVAELDGIIANENLQTFTGNAVCDVTVAQINYLTLGVHAGSVMIDAIRAARLAAPFRGLTMNGKFILSGY